ncbi:hypothetical protein RUM43_008607 [Polyplax serrata]|uniref:Methyltransferase type 11 domain-containing protein n=1 Tax=Polyplax serrata TaxID=468196 RepID=A0AAN8P633_POLSC
MPFKYFEGEAHIRTYNKFRPSPPNSLTSKVIEFTKEKVPLPLQLAVDVGCGSGQSTEVLAPFFKNILGFDSSYQIIIEARKRCRYTNISYRTCPGENMDLEDGTVDLVTVGQAVHWFDIPKFYMETNRVLKSKGVLAVYGYNLPIPMYKDNMKVQTLVQKYYTDVLGDYTLPQSRLAYLNNYKSKEFNEVNFIEGGQMLRNDDCVVETEGTLCDIIGYIKSWSAFQNYAKQKGEQRAKLLLEQFKNEFNSLVKDPFCSLQIKFNYFLLLGRKL